MKPLAEFQFGIEVVVGAGRPTLDGMIDACSPNHPSRCMVLGRCANLANSGEGVCDGMEQGQERKNMVTKGGEAGGYNTTTVDRCAKYTNSCEANESMRERRE